MKKILTAALAASTLALAAPAADAHFYGSDPSTAHNFNVNVLCNTGTWWCLEAYNGGVWRTGLHTTNVMVYTARWRPVWTTQRFTTHLKIIHGGVVEANRQ